MYNFRVGMESKNPVSYDKDRIPRITVIQESVIEYKDMFPFEGRLKDVAVVNHYNKSHIFEHAFKWKHVFILNKESCGTVILGHSKKG